MKQDKSIIQSLTDTDFYKFTMGQFVWKLFPNVNVTYGFKNRTKEVPLAKIIDEGQLREELDHARTLKFTNSELHYIGGTFEYGNRMFSEEFVNFLQSVSLPEYLLEQSNDGYRLEFSGPWHFAIYWETLALSIINELYNRALTKDMTNFQRNLFLADGMVRLGKKNKEIKRFRDLFFSDFGTRRRYSRKHQDFIVGALVEEFSETKQFLGTSNVSLAMKYGVMPMGTSAHELFMVTAGLNDGSDMAMQGSQNQIFEKWWEMYGYGLSIALPDTFGSAFTFKTFLREWLVKWKGFRQDSGDPIYFAQKLLFLYKKHEIDPKEKVIIFSDGLDVGKIIKLHRDFSGKIRCTYGWGTNLTNDVGTPPLSLVVKPIRANGYNLVKLSDNLAKAIGRQEDIERYKKVFTYDETFFEPCTY